MGVVTPQEVHQRIEAFCEAHKDDGFGITPGYEFAHIVIDDHNLDDDFIEWCIGRADQWEREELGDLRRLYADSPFVIPSAERTVRLYKEDALELLRWLLAVPEEVRDEAMPLGYDYDGPVVGVWAE